MAGEGRAKGVRVSGRERIYTSFELAAKRAAHQTNYMQLLSTSAGAMSGLLNDEAKGPYEGTDGAGLRGRGRSQWG